MNSLYNVTCKFLEFMNDDEITEEQAEKLGKELAKELQNDSANVIAYIVDSESRIERTKAEEKRLSDVRKAEENKLARFKEYVKENMNALNLQKIPTELGTLSITKNPMSVEITEEAKIPKEFVEVITTTKINKKSIAEHFKATGEVIDGVIIHTDNTSLRIK